MFTDAHTQNSSKDAKKVACVALLDIDWKVLFDKEMWFDLRKCDRNTGYCVKVALSRAEESDMGWRIA
ncbi:hypothetical protein T4E_2468 [Trichinella pseudospiralis]|uniref:Uncharacterized protein n=1 Tax=Trichinella pseudospiralis TaxID=6337 RepID=A0A0V0Y532_TRIPS|nr:hypothetical protein T4E_2468 [Trichinella pseudospiralis]